MPPPQSRRRDLIKMAMEKVNLVVTCLAFFLINFATLRIAAQEPELHGVSSMSDQSNFIDAEAEGLWDIFEPFSDTQIEGFESLFSDASSSQSLPPDTGGLGDQISSEWSQTHQSKPLNVGQENQIGFTSIPVRDPYTLNRARNWSPSIFESEDQDVESEVPISSNWRSPTESHSDSEHKRTALKEDDATPDNATFAEEANFRTLPPVGTNVAAASPIPLPVRGKCIAGTKYVITSVKDLQKNIGDLECIFAAGVSPGPGQIPLGYNYGTLLAAANTAFWDNLLNLGYQGDYVVRTQCRRQYYNIGLLSAAGLKVGTAVWYTGLFPFENKLAEGEYPLGKKANIVMDFTVDFNDLCPPEGNGIHELNKGFNPFRNSIYPINNFIDVGRIVGRDCSDGGLITLNKAFIISGSKARTAFMYATKNFDPTVAPEFAEYAPQPIFVPLGPGGKTEVHYFRSSVGGIAQELVQGTLNNIPANPILPFGATDNGPKVAIPFPLSAIAHSPPLLPPKSFLSPTLVHSSNRPVQCDAVTCPANTNLVIECDSDDPQCNGNSRQSGHNQRKQYTADPTQPPQSESPITQREYVGLQSFLKGSVVKNYGDSKEENASANYDENQSSTLEDIDIFDN